MPDFYLIGKITSTSGRNGFLNISSYSDFPDRFSELKEVYIDFYGIKKLFLVEDIKEKKNNFIIKLKNFNSDEDAQFLIQKELFVSEASAVKLPENFFFIHDLIGSKVVRENVEVGVITDVLNFPANDVYVIRGSNQKEILLPAVLDIIEKFDPVNKMLILKPGAGVYEDDEN